MAGLFDIVKVDINSPFFNYKNSSCYDQEKLLFSHLETEAFDNFGVKFFYYIMDYNTKRDRLFGEDMDRYCQRKFMTMAYISQLPAMIPNFGLPGITIPEIDTLFISITHFKQASTLSYTDDALLLPERFDSIVPKVGDYLKSTYNNKFYEIINVKDSEASSQFHQNKTTYTLNVRVWSNENFGINATSGVPTSSLFDLSAVMNQPDFLSVNNDAEVEDQKIQYIPKAGEHDPTDPFGGY